MLQLSPAASQAVPTPRAAAATKPSPPVLVRSLPRPARRPYDRCRDIPQLLPLWPNERAALADTAIATTRTLTARLAAALRQERRNGVAGDPAYDLNRHQALVHAWRAETTALRSLLKTLPKRQPPPRRCHNSPALAPEYQPISASKRLRGVGQP